MSYSRKWLDICALKKGGEKNESFSHKVWFIFRVMNFIITIMSLIDENWRWKLLKLKYRIILLLVDDDFMRFFFWITRERKRKTFSNSKLWDYAKSLLFLKFKALIKFITANWKLGRQKLPLIIYELIMLHSEKLEHMSKSFAWKLQK